MVSFIRNIQTVVFNLFILSPTVATTLKNLVALYRKIGKMDAAEVLEDLTAARINKEVHLTNYSLWDNKSLFLF